MQPYLLFARRACKWFFAAFLNVINQRVPITTNKAQGNRELAMPAVYQFLESLVGAPESALSEIHHSEISLHRAKAHYDYPTIRLPHSFSKLAGLQARIYHTVHDGGLASLVVVSTACYAAEKSAIMSESAAKNAKSFVFTRRNSLLPVFLRLRVYDVHRRATQGR